MNPFLQKMTGSRSPTLFMDNDPANGESLRADQPPNSCHPDGD